MSSDPETPLQVKQPAELKAALAVSRVDPADREKQSTLEHPRRGLPMSQRQATSSPAGGDKGNFGRTLTPDQEAEMLPALAQLLDAAVMEGHKSFQAAASQALADVESKLGPAVAGALTIKHLQGAYIAMSSRYPDGDVDTVATVAQFTTKDQLRENGSEEASAGGAELDRRGRRAPTVEPPELGDIAVGAVKGIDSGERPLVREGPARMDRRLKISLILAVAAVAGTLAWFFRFQPLPTAAIAAVQNRWTGSIYYVGGSGRMVRAPAKESEDE